MKKVRYASKTDRKVIKEIQHFQKEAYKTRLWKTWANMFNRCFSEHPRMKKYYGDTKICQEWLIWERFRDWALKNGYQDNLEIDRIDGSGHYQPSNCRFVTHRENLLNRCCKKSKNNQ